MTMPADLDRQWQIQQLSVEEASGEFASTRGKRCSRAKNDAAGRLELEELLEQDRNVGRTLLSPQTERERKSWNSGNYAGAGIAR